MRLSWLWLWVDKLCSLPKDDHHRGQASGEGQVAAVFLLFRNQDPLDAIFLIFFVLKECLPGVATSSAAALQQTLPLLELLLLDVEAAQAKGAVGSSWAVSEQKQRAAKRAAKRAASQAATSPPLAQPAQVSRQCDWKTKQGGIFNFHMFSWISDTFHKTLTVSNQQQKQNGRNAMECNGRKTSVAYIKLMWGCFRKVCVVMCSPPEISFCPYSGTLVRNFNCLH